MKRGVNSTARGYRRPLRIIRSTRLREALRLLRLTLTNLDQDLGE